MNSLIVGNSNSRLAAQIIRILNDCGCDTTLIDELQAMEKPLEALHAPLVVLTAVNDNVLTLTHGLRRNDQFTSVVLAIIDDPAAFDTDQLLNAGIDDIILHPLEGFQLESRLSFAIRRAEQRSEKNQIEAALRESESNALAIVNTSVDGIITIDEHCIIESYNRAAEQIFGYTPDEVIGNNINILMPPPFKDEHDGYVKSYHETEHKKIIGIGREVRGLRKNGETFPMELAVSEIRNGRHRAYAGIVRDISVRRELELKLLQIAEEERRRIGQDIHDGLGQMLTGIGLIAQNLAKNLKTKNEHGAEAVFELVDLIKNADQQARAIARMLVPLELENGGLKAAILRLSANIERLYGLKCSYEETGKLPQIPSGVKTHFYRIIQEAMGNAAKHSKASHIDVAVAGNADKIRMRIRDNGTGIDFNHANGRGMGLRIMKYRAHVIGATLDIRNGSKDGTVVTCTLPVSTFALPA